MQNTAQPPVAPDDAFGDDADLKVIEAIEAEERRRRQIIKDAIDAQEVADEQRRNTIKEKAKRRNLIKDAAEKYGPNGALAKEGQKRLYERYREEDRADYAAKKGAPVRPYRRGLNAPTPEQRKVEEAAAARERYAAQKGAPVRPRLDLSGMTPEQKAAHKREQSRQRMERKRIRDRAGNARQA